MKSIEYLLNQIFNDPSKMKLLFIQDDRVTRKTAAEMCGISLPYFDEKIRKPYKDIIGENKAFGNKVTFSRHGILKAIEKINGEYEAKYKTA